VKCALTLLLALLTVPSPAAPLVGLEGEGAGLPELSALRVGEEFDEEAADRALREAAASLAAEGYLDARLTPVLVPREGGVVLRVELTRGTRAPLGELTVNGAWEVEPRLVEAAARTGWRRDGPRGLRSAVVDLYASRGYMGAQIGLAWPKRTPDRALNLVLVVEEGGLTGVGPIEVTGLEGEASRRTALAALGLERGDPLTPDVLEAARRRLERTGYYGRVELNLEGEAGPQTPLRLSLEPGRSVYLDGALGLGERGDETALYGELQFNLLNLGGGGHDLSGLYRRTADDDADYRAGYTKRFLFGSRAALEVAYLGLLRADRRSDAGEATLRQPLGDHLELSFTARFSSDFQEGVGSSVLLGAGLGARLDYTDRPRNPAGGFDLWCELTAGQRRYEERRETPLRARLGGDFYWTPLEPHTLALLTEAGLADVRPPVSLDCFYLGGAARPRGYRSRELPTDAYALATTEYRLRLGESGRLFAFGDFAYLRPISTTPVLAPTTWWWGIGYGLGLVVNLGVGGLEVVYALERGSRLDSGVIQVRLVLDRLL
jgi:outer membrane protein assembly factor BamA